MTDVTRILNALRQGKACAAADVLGVSVITAKRDWACARAWLHHAIDGGCAKKPRCVDTICPRISHVAATPRL